jgi:hypothetical protein
MLRALYALGNYMKLNYIFGFLISFQCLATPTLESFVLDKDSAKRLGFSYTITVDKLTKMIDLKGPAKLKNNCKPLALGNFVIGANDEEISVFIGNPNINEPQALGFISSNSNFKLVVFIDYTCPDGFMSDSRRYMVSTD